MRENFSLIVHSQMKLCLFKVAKSDACIRPLFANPVTYSFAQITVCVIICVHDIFIIIIPYSFNMQWHKYSTHARTHACTHARMHARMHTRTHACTHACMHAPMHARAHACTQHTENYIFTTDFVLIFKKPFLLAIAILGM